MLESTRNGRGEHACKYTHAQACAMPRPCTLIFVLPGQVKEGPLVLEIYQKPIDPRRKRIRYVVTALLPVTIRSVASLHVTRVLLLLCWRWLCRPCSAHSVKPLYLHVSLAFHSV